MGLSISVLLAQHEKVFAVDIVPSKVEMVKLNIAWDTVCQRLLVPVSVVEEKRQSVLKVMVAS